MPHYTIRGLGFPQGPPAIPAVPNNQAPPRLHRALRAPVGLYTRVVDNLPISGAQALGTITNGTVTLSVGPTGLGTVWRPASAVVAVGTTPSILNTGICSIYVGPSGVPTALQGIVNSGTGVLSLAIPVMTPGLSIIAIWTGMAGANGSPVSLNITGAMSVLDRW